MGTEALKGLLQSIFVLWFPGFYTLIAIYVALAFSHVVNGWITMALMLSPCIATWYIVVSRREASFIRMQQGSSFKWDVDDALHDYQELILKQQRKKTN
jgi:urea transporter